jgi:1-acyl-sn-glycerol-3-phosphate acyltransferase
MGIEGAENVPAAKGLIVAANHVSGWDVVAVACALRRPVFFMAKEEFFRRPLIGWLFRRLNAIPVKRGAPDMKAIRRALELLRQGQVIGIFPEGHRGRSGEQQEAMSGVIFLMEKSGAPLIPARVFGTEKFLSQQRDRLGIVLGAPLTLMQLPAEPENGDRRELQAAQLMERIQQLSSGSFAKMSR